MDPSPKTTAKSRLLLEVRRDGAEDDEVYAVQRMMIGSGEGDTVEVPEVGPGFAVVRWDNSAYVVRGTNPADRRIVDENTGDNVCELVLAAGVAFRIGGSRFRCVAAPATVSSSGGEAAGLDWTASCPFCNQPMDWEEKDPCHFCNQTSRTLNDREGRWHGRVPSKLGAFVVDRWVACGGMGVVLRGKGSDGNLVALKLLRSRHPDSTALRRFEDEMRLTVGLPPHPNLVFQMGHGVEEMLPWLAMEWVEGDTLADRLRADKRQMAIREIESIMRQLVAGLRHLHAHGIVHRDLKPANIFIKPCKGVKIGDFGLARNLNAATQATLTLTGAVVGTALYMSPEVHNGHEATMASDIYALGLIWQEMLTCAHTGGLLVVNRQDCPMAWKKAIHRMLSLDPHSRPSLNEIEPRLGQLFRGRSDYLMDRGKRISKWVISMVKPMIWPAPESDRDGADFTKDGPDKPRLWDPVAAARASLILTPAYGAFFHASNWRVMGNPKRAFANMIWFWITIGFAILSIVSLLRFWRGMRFYPLVELGLFCGWYFTQGRTQTDCIKRRFGDNYTKRGGKLPGGLGLLAGLVLNMFVILGACSDFENSPSRLRKRANGGDSKAMSKLAYLYFTGDGVVKDEREGVAWLTKAAKAGSLEAMTALGVRYGYGRGVEKNITVAMFFLRRAASLGSKDAAKWLLKIGGESAEGMDWLGLCYLNGTGVTKNDVEAAKWFRKSADAGDSEGMWRLGLCYWSGTGVTRNDEEAAKWLRKSADAGDSEGMWRLGLCYCSGRGLTKNDEEAAKWYRKSAEAGDSGGMACLGGCYENGTGVAKNEPEAIKWYRKSADAGNSIGMTCLGECYRKGVGVAKDIPKAIQWLRKAADLGDETAAKSLLELGGDKAK